jgi:hypothetical protein
LRIVANLASDDASKEPVLLVLDNAVLAKCLTGKSDSSAPIVKAFGKDFGQQWMEPLDKVAISSKVQAAAASAFSSDSIAIVDLVNHLEEDAAEEWMSNAALTKHVAKVV